MKLKLFPWDNEEQPYWINPNNGIEWYVDQSTTNWCSRYVIQDWPKLNATCFYVCTNIEGKIKPITRILIDNVTNEIIADETSLEVLSVKIDWLRLVQSIQT